MKSNKKNMKKYRIQFQKTIFNINEKIENGKAYVYSKVVDFNNIKMTLTFGEEYNPEKNSNDMIQEIIFFNESEGLPNFKHQVFFDPYFMLEVQMEDGSWKVLQSKKYSFCKEKFYLINL